MTAVPALFPVFDHAAARTRAVGSSVRLAQPLMRACNHQLGILGTPFIFVRAPTPAASTSMARQAYTHRHPNATHVFVWLRHGAAAQTTATITVTAGSGTPTEVTISEPTGREGELAILAPWDAADTGYCVVKVEGSDVGFSDVIAWEVSRASLDDGDGDLCVEAFDSAVPLGGLRQARRIVESDVCGVSGVIATAAAAWTYGLRQPEGWWDYEAREVDSTDWTCPYADDMPTRAIGRKAGSEATRDHRVYAWTWCDAGTTFEWRVTAQNPLAGSDTVTSGSLTHTSGAWTGSPLTGLRIDTGGAADLLFEMRRTAGAGKCYVLSRSVIEEKL